MIPAWLWDHNGREVFDQQCAACHGAKGEGGVDDRLVRGQGTLATPKPVRTVGSYWPYALTLSDYIRRTMPRNAPHSLSNDDVYAVSMVRPCVARRFQRAGGKRSCINVSGLWLEAMLRAIMDISAL